MLDLYADWCVACKEFEKYTFSDPQVQNALKAVLLPGGRYSKQRAG
jgi:thiol:disulfide interchange protein DsbD